MQSDFAVNKYRYTVASGWIFINNEGHSNFIGPYSCTPCALWRIWLAYDNSGLFDVM